MKCGEPFTNRDLAAVGPEGALVWTIYWRDGRKKWDEAHRIYREADGDYSLVRPDMLQAEKAAWGYGEEFTSDYSTDPDEQAVRDVHEGIFLYHVWASDE